MFCLAARLGLDENHAAVCATRLAEITSVLAPTTYRWYGIEPT